MQPITVAQRRSQIGKAEARVGEEQAGQLEAELRASVAETRTAELEAELRRLRGQ